MVAENGCRKQTTGNDARLMTTLAVKAQLPACLHTTHDPLANGTQRIPAAAQQRAPSSLLARASLSDMKGLPQTTNRRTTSHTVPRIEELLACENFTTWGATASWSPSPLWAVPQSRHKNRVRAGPARNPPGPPHHTRTPHHTTPHPNHTCD